VRPDPKCDDAAVIVRQLSREISPVLQSQMEVGEEFELLFSRALEDPPMAIARARRLLEVLVADRLALLGMLGPLHAKKASSLHKMIEKLTDAPPYSKELASVCHAVRLEGNRVLHYLPGCPVRVEVSPFRLVECLRRVSEVAEMTTTGDTTIYVASLPPRVAAMYRRLRGPWAQALRGKKKGSFPLSEALLLLFRSVAARLKPGWLDYLTRLNEDDTLAVGLAQEDEHAIRQLRNRGLIEHDGPWLFTPTRSERAWPSPRGQFLLHLDGQQGGDVPEGLAVEVIRSLGQIQKGSHLFALLKRFQESGSFSQTEEPHVRRLRNLHFVGHTANFLAGADEVSLTDLGYYVFGRLMRD
jgi:hypothetical protein